MNTTPVLSDRKSTRLNSSHSSTSYSVFFFNDTATTEIYTLSLHDALPISSVLHSFLSSGTSRYGVKSNNEYNSCFVRSEEHTSELQSQFHLLFRLLF